uniref:Uncharacterized protein n=1 Tax=viral metagenome TaxID=1070528 RepID=A0A6C0IDU2_9ZZZZ
MTFLDAAIGMNNIQNLRHGASGGERAKNIGALVGKIAGTTLLAAGMIGGLAKLGSTTASLIRKDVLWQEHRLLNPLEKYGKKKGPSTLAKMFPQHRGQHPSLTRSLWHSLFPAKQRAMASGIETLSAPDRYSFLRPTPPRSATWRDWWIEQNMGRPNQTLARIVEARGDEANAYHQAIRQNYLHARQQSLRSTIEQDAAANKQLLFHGRYLVPKNNMTQFLEPSFLQEASPFHFVADRQTASLNSMLSDYESNRRIVQNVHAMPLRKLRATNQNLFLDALFDENRTERSIFNDVRTSRGEISYLQRRPQNFEDPFLQAKLNTFYTNRHIVRGQDMLIGSGIGLGIFVVAIVGGVIIIYKATKDVDNFNRRV